MAKGKAWILVRLEDRTGGEAYGRTLVARNGRHLLREVAVSVIVVQVTGCGGKLWIEAGAFLAAKRMTTLKRRQDGCLAVRHSGACRNSNKRSQYYEGCRHAQNGYPAAMVNAGHLSGDIKRCRRHAGQSAATPIQLYTFVLSFCQSVDGSAARSVLEKAKGRGSY